MIKKIIISSLICVSLIFILTLKMEEIGNAYLFLICLISFAFAAFLIREIYKNYIADFKPKNSGIEYENSGDFFVENIKKISTRPFLFGLENKLISDNEFYFDDEHLYAINKNFQKAVFKLTDISELSKTTIEINNRRLWQVKIKPENESEITFKFAHNYTIWNKNFVLFHEKMMLINSAVVKTKWNVWNR